MTVTVSKFNIASKNNECTLKLDIQDIFGACIIKLITAVIYGFHNKLECLSLNTRLKGFCGTNTLYYGNHKLRPKKFYYTGPWKLPTPEIG
jgi:hypothetical protein